MQKNCLHLQCAVVLAKLERFDWEVQQRIEIGKRYNTMLDEKEIERVTQRDDRTSVFAQYTVLLDEREAVQAKLTEAVFLPPSITRFR